MQTEKIAILARDEYPLSATLFKPNNVSKGVIQFHGGTGIPQKLYENFAINLAERGFTVITFDYRGIGDSNLRHPKKEKSRLSDWGKLDMTSIFDWVISTYPNQKKIIVAHSMGGQLIGFMDNYKHIDAIILIASATGYWRDISSPVKWKLGFLFYFLMPLHFKSFGYLNAMQINQGENLPKNVALELRKWCLNPNYFKDEFEKNLHPTFYDKIKVPIYSIQVEDDPLANSITANKLLEYYNSSKIDKKVIKPKTYGVSKIGHTGFFSRKFINNLWNDLTSRIEKTVANNV